jgi:CheY-like chemotaxis protein
MRQEHRVTTDAARPCLLVIEDNPADVQLLQFTLSDAGLDCEIVTIADGQKALAWVRQQSEDAAPAKPQLLIVDLNLPKHDGIEILEAMQQNPSLAVLPVLVLSSSPSPRDAARVTAFPNTKYMTKPSDLDGYGELSTVLRQMLDSHGAAQAAPGV